MDVFLHLCDLCEKQHSRFPSLFSRLTCHLTSSPLWSTKERQNFSSQTLRCSFFSFSICLHLSIRSFLTVEHAFMAAMCAAHAAPWTEWSALISTLNRKRHLALQARGGSQETTFWEHQGKIWFQQFVFHPLTSYFDPRQHLHCHDSVAVNQKQSTLTGEGVLVYFPPPKWTVEVEFAGFQRGGRST